MTDTSKQGKFSDAKLRSTLQDLATELLVLGNTPADNSRKNYINVYSMLIRDYLDKKDNVNLQVLREMSELMTLKGGAELNRRLSLIGDKESITAANKRISYNFGVIRNTNIEK